MKSLIIIIAFILFSFHAHAQPGVISAEQAIDLALKNNAGIQAAAFQVKSQNELRKTSMDLPKTDAFLQYGQTNSYAKDNNLVVTQTIPFTALGSLASLNRSLLASSQLKKVMAENELIYLVKQTYYQLAYVQAHRDLLERQDSIYEGFLKSASLRYKTGETNLLEQATAEVQRNDIKNSLRENEADILILKTRLKALLNSNSFPEIMSDPLPELKLKADSDTSSVLNNPSLSYSRQQIEVAKNQKKVETAKFAPDLLIGFFSQTLIGTVHPETGRISTKTNRFTGIEVGLSIPLWFVPHQAKARSASYNVQATEKTYENDQILFQRTLQQAFQQHAKYKNSLDYYLGSALPNSNLILKQSQTAFREGDIGYVEYLQGIRNAISIKESYLRTLNDYNQSIIYIEYLSGNK